MTSAISRPTFQERLATGWTWWCLGGAIALADFATKQLVRMTMPLGDQIPLTGFFNLVHVSNAGAAFSMLAGAGGWQRYFFTVIAVVVSLCLVWMLSSTLTRIEALAYSLILGGAIGNAADRVMYGAVTDFLDVYLRNWHWPAFNLADVAICVGALALITAAFLDAQARTKSQRMHDSL
jgi:signal peptidase II